MLIRRLIVSISVAAAVLVVGCGSSDEVDPEQDALNVVEAAYASFNNGDADTWVEIRDRGSSYASDADREEGIAILGAETERRVDEGWQYEDIECDSQGEGEWPVADDGDVAGHYITCETSLVDGDGELVYPEAFEWVVQDGEVVAVRSDD
jgi:hypothetical protein